MAKRRSTLRLVFSITALVIVLAFNTQALANSINNLVPTDSSFTLFGVNGSTIFVLTPESTVHLNDFGYADFASGQPLGWTSGSLTLTVSFDNQQFVSSFPKFSTGPCSPTIVCIQYFIADLPVTQRVPATFTVSFGGPNGGTASTEFFIAPVPEPSAMLLFCTGAAFLAAKYRRYKPTVR